MPSEAPDSSSDIFQRNTEYLPNHVPQYHYKNENFTSVSRMIIVTCMDQRVIPEDFCGLKAGEIPVIRCAAGRARFAIHDIAILNTLIGINEILLIHHTDCGATHKNEEHMRSKVEALSVKEAAKIDFEGLYITNLQQSVRDDLLWLREHPLIKTGTILTGAVYDIDTGKLDKVGSI